MREELAQLAHVLGSRKLEEGDWKQIYCGVKGIPESGWSNLPFADIIYHGLGVEHKLMGSDVKPANFCGKSKMHPAATRSFRIDPALSAESQKRSVLKQYGELISTFRKRVAETSPNREADLRTGWLFYHRGYAQFVYFEEELRAPRPSDYVAEWVTTKRQGGRKPSKNLWIYERRPGSTRGQKRFSVTTVAGAKIQPYVDIPNVGTAGLYIFDIFDVEAVVDGLPKLGIWVTESAYRAVEEAAHERGFDSLENFLEKTNPKVVAAESAPTEPKVTEHFLSRRAHETFRSLPGKNDEERIRRIYAFMRSAQSA